MDRYAEVVDYMYRALPMYQRIGAAAYKADLDNTIALCEALGNPERAFRSVHVAGTNGKGSTSHMIAAILQSAGYKTGLYTSPHLKEFTERIRINGADVEKEFVVEFIDKTRKTLDRLQPSFFEMTVGMAFDYFASRKVDIAVVEVGLGGRLDSTNVITPDVSVITNISWDHMMLLGDTLPKIAAEKAGIIKPGVPVVVSERQEAVEDVFIHRAAQLDSPLLFASDEIQLHENDGGYDVYRNGSLWLEGLIAWLKGDYQKENLAGVLVVVQVLRDAGYIIPDSAIKAGIAGVVSLTGLKGRWQILRERPLTIADTAHNEAGIQRVVQQLRALSHRRLHLVIGMVNDKDLSRVLSLLPKEGDYFFCQANIPRALDAGELAERAKGMGLKGVVEKDVNRAIQLATDASQPGDVIFVGGSTFVVGEVEGL